MAAIVRMGVFDKIMARYFSLSAIQRGGHGPADFTKAIAVASKYGKAALMYKNIFLLGSVPAIAGLQYYCYILPHEPRPEFKEYEHLRIRRKKFPWRDGVQSAFHNPKRNALPGIGYEEEDDHH